MEYYNDINNLNIASGSVVTLGKFDGMHLGHQKLLKRVREISDTRNLSSVMFTFSAPPATAMGGAEQKLIVTREEKKLLAQRFGMDIFIECPFNDSLKNMTADDFVNDVLINRINARAVVAGTDFHFGKNRQGDAAFLEKNAGLFSYGVDIIDKEKDGERDISSTYVREELAAGHIEKVNALLGYEYFISGEVVGGMHIGHNLGFPTINIAPDKNKLLPPNGVYSSYTHTDGQTYRSISNIGVRPTIGGRALAVETFILDFNGNLYGKGAAVHLIEFMRPEIRFDSIDALKEQVLSDIAKRREKK